MRVRLVRLVRLVGHEEQTREMTGRAAESAVELFTAETDYGPRSVWWASVDSVEPLDAEAEAIILPMRAAARLKREAFRGESRVDWKAVIEGHNAARRR